MGGQSPTDPRSQNQCETLQGAKCLNHLNRPNHFNRLNRLPLQVKAGYEALLAYYGENLNSTSSDTEFWSAIAVFVER